MRKTPVTLGVLSMVFGGLVALYSGFNLAFQSLSGSFMSSLGQMAASAPRKPGQPDPTVLFAKMGDVIKSVAPYTTALLTGKVLFSVALIAIGYGLYKRMRWARSGAIAWAGLGLVYLVAEIMVTVGVVQPRVNAAMQEIFRAMPSGDPGAAMMQAMQGTQSTITVVTNLVLYAPFPIILLILCGRRSAAADFVD
jgi:roadblock/LC7 domain-containing protein